MEAPAHHGGTVATAGVTNPKKRSLDEVVPPAFEAREEEDGAYGVAEMPKRFMLGNQHLVPDKYRGRMATFYAMDARIDAVMERAERSAAALLQKLAAKDAARAAVAAGQQAGQNTASSI